MEVPVGWIQGNTLYELSKLLTSASMGRIVISWQSFNFYHGCIGGNGDRCDFFPYFSNIGQILQTFPPPHPLNVFSFHKKNPSN